MKLKFTLALIFTSLFSFAQQYMLSEDAEISALTIGPGSYLVDSFGHSAFRVRDREKNIDLVFNYGTYDFETSNFKTFIEQRKMI